MTGLLGGICLWCGKKFWWTGEKNNRPPCSCGRFHGEMDWLGGKGSKPTEDDAA